MIVIFSNVMVIVNNKDLKGQKIFIIFDKFYF